MKKIPVRPKMNAPGGINNTMVINKAKEAEPCRFCFNAPKVSCRNLAIKPTVGRMFNYTLKCKCGKYVIHSSIEECVALWNLRYGIPQGEDCNFERERSSFVSDDDKEEFFN